MNYEIKILSPVHIGTGKKITPFEFALTEDKFIVIDMDKVLAGNPDRADALNSRLSRDVIHFSLSDFLTADEKNNRSFWKYCARLDSTTKAVLNEELRKAKNMDVDECIKTTTDYQVYIPGSSLKGAFRTALAYATFRADENLFKDLKERLKKVDWRRSDQTVNELIFWGAGNDPKYDLFKTLRLSDSSTLPTNEQSLGIDKMKILSLTASSKQQDSSQQGTMYAQLQALRSERSPLKHWWTIQETLKPGITFTGKGALEDRLLNKKVLGWNERQRKFAPEQLIRSANTFSSDICDWELNFFEKQVEGIDVKPILTFYKELKNHIENTAEHTCYLCLGQGAGWHKMTIGMLLEHDKNFDFRVLRKKLRLADRRLDFEYPKSRKILMESDDEIQAVFGWVKVEFV